jgi:hypothetical protein
MNGKAVARKGHGKHQTTSAGSIRRPKNAYRFEFASTMGRGTQEKRMLRAQHPAKREMAGRARLCLRPESSRRHKRLDYHNRARPLMNAEIIRLKLAWYDAFLLKIFLTIRDARFPLRRGIRARWKDS